ncbi:hypothetical protein QA612_10725 [Evansella sp. AB-P1]|uniref:hypothetical protein n=1 Tax=Evansella sp. AB-P1 TaxID=3037653 RepID=UPI00241F2A3E|nr:hypothetical protein [Evansella sp. AB-P1]MDG5787962.1 hypothetical protein [Evansella sp. AB-P1]
MTKRLWDDQDVENHLKQLPPIKDRQSKEELFQAIERKMQERNEKPSPLYTKNKHKLTWLKPLMASVAAVFLIVLIFPYFFNGDYEMSYNSDNNADISAGNDMNNSNDGDFNIAGTPSDDGGVDTESDEENTILLPVPHFFEVLTVNEFGDEGLYTKSGITSQPISIGENRDSSLENLIYYTLTSDEVDWGIQDSRSLHNEISSVNIDDRENAVTIDFFNSINIERLSSNEATSFYEAILEYFGYFHFEKIRFTFNDEPGVLIGPFGFVEEWDIPYENRGYYLHEDEEGNHYFVRGAYVGERIMENGELLSFQETLGEMLVVNEGAWYRSAIPESIEIEDVVIEDIHAAIFVNDTGIIPTVEEFDLLVEALTFTANDFSIEYISFIGNFIDEMSQVRQTEMIHVNDF